MPSNQSTTKDYLNHHPMFWHIYHSNKIENVTSLDEVYQSLTAWEFLSRSDITFDVIMETHRLITLNLLQSSFQGRLRGHWVQVGNYIPPGPSDIEDMLKEWIRVFMDSTSPRIHHVWFESIHPLADGNGRIGRMLMWRHEKLLGLEPTLIRFEERAEYYKWFRNPHPMVEGTRSDSYK